MKKISLALIVIASAGLLSFKGENIKGNGKIVMDDRQTGTFNKLATAGSLDITLIQGDKEGVSITTDENIQSAIITEVKGSTLAIHLKEGSDIDPTKLTIKVYCRNLNSISTGGSGDMATEGKLKSDKLEISQGGSGDFSLNLDVQDLKINMAGSGDFKLDGSAKEFTVSAAGSGDVDAAKLKTDDVSISMAGSGDVVLAPGTKPKVQSAGSGEVHYHNE